MNCACTCIESLFFRYACEQCVPNPISNSGFWWIGIDIEYYFENSKKKLEYIFKPYFIWKCIKKNLDIFHVFFLLWPICARVCGYFIAFRNSGFPTHTCGVCVYVVAEQQYNINENRMRNENSFYLVGNCVWLLRFFWVLLVMIFA